MNFTFRVDSSLDIGSGHIMRTLTLARFLRGYGHHCVFICRDLTHHLGDLVAGEGFNLMMLPCPGPKTPKVENIYQEWLGVSAEQDFQECLPLLATRDTHWLIVDHYSLDYIWETQAKNFTKKILVIDDLANRRHDCDVLLDQTFGRQIKEYKDKVPSHCEILVGSIFSILRPEFAEVRAHRTSHYSRRESFRILVNLGGIDKDNVTCEVLEILKRCQFNEAVSLVVVLGALSPWIDEVKLVLDGMTEETVLEVGSKNMAELMSRSHLAIGAAGTTTWERCCVGLPTITLVVAENQIEISRRLQDHGVIIATDLKNLAGHVVRLLNDSGELLSKLSENALEVCDGRGVERIYDYLKLES